MLDQIEGLRVYFQRQIVPPQRPVHHAEVAGRLVVRRIDLAGAMEQPRRLVELAVGQACEDIEQVDLEQVRVDQTRRLERCRSIVEAARGAEGHVQRKVRFDGAIRGAMGRAMVCEYVYIWGVASSY